MIKPKTKTKNSIVSLVFTLIIFLAVFFIIYVGLIEYAGAPPLKEVFNVSNNSSETTIIKETIITTETIESMPDLRALALPYLASTDAKDICERIPLATWHWSSEWVGCQGAGAIDCTSALHLSAQTQCVGVGADWICNINNMYCKYN